MGVFQSAVRSSRCPKHSRLTLEASLASATTCRTCRAHTCTVEGGGGGRSTL
jgi:hypothetical protein